MDISFVFTLIYSIGNLVGRTVSTGVFFLSGTVLPDAVVNTVGLLTIVTLLLFFVERKRKLTWDIVYLCWGLIIMKIGLLMYNNR